MFINSRLTACIALLLNVFISQAVSQAPGLYPQASKRLLTEQELRAYDNATLKIMRNEIFARYGYIFKTSDMVEYFSKQSWYKPTLATAPKLTSIEEQNVALIKSLESGASTTPQLRSFATISKPIFPETALRDLTRSELAEYSLSQLVVMRNEIVARYGYIFKDKEIAQHFTKQPWYKPVLQTLPKLSAVEQSNLELLDKVIGERNADKKVQMLPSQASTKFYTKQLTQKQLPKEIKYKGKFDQAYEWGDKDGIHVIIASSNIKKKNDYMQSHNANLTIYRKQVNGYQPIWADTVLLDGEFLGDNYKLDYTIGYIKSHNGYGVVYFSSPDAGRTDVPTFEEIVTEVTELCYRGKRITHIWLREPVLGVDIDTISNNIALTWKPCGLQFVGEDTIYSENPLNTFVAKEEGYDSLKCTSVPLIIGQIRKAHVFKIESVTTSSSEFVIWMDRICLGIGPSTDFDYIDYDAIRSYIYYSGGYEICEDSDLKQCEKLSVGETMLIYGKTYTKKITKLKEFDVNVTKLEP